jgi:hypothetical protein
MLLVGLVRIAVWNHSIHSELASETHVAPMVLRSLGLGRVGDRQAFTSNIVTNKSKSRRFNCNFKITLLSAAFFIGVS